MRRSAIQSEKQAKEREPQSEPKAKKSRLNDRTTNFVILDNGMMVEVFTFLNYSQLANNSLVSKRFHDVIKTHRHKLALLYVDYIFMRRFNRFPVAIKIFDKALSPETYNAWVMFQLSAAAYIEWFIRISLSNQILFEDQDATTLSTQDVPNAYLLCAGAFYKDSNNREQDDKTSVLHALVELNLENWPVFHHFVRLITDPFIFIRSMSLTPQNYVLNMLSGAINSDRSHLQCNELTFHLRDNDQKFITWAKTHVRCNRFWIDGVADLNQDGAFLDFILTAAHCTQSIIVKSRELSKAMVYFVQKFLDVGNWDEYQGVLSIDGYHFVENQDVKILKNDYGKFLVKEEHEEDGTTYVFEFINNAIGKQLQLTASILNDVDDYPTYSDFPSFLVEIKDL